MNGSVLSQAECAQQSVHWTLGILRDLGAFFWLRVFSAPKQSPRPPQRHASRKQAVGRQVQCNIKSQRNLSG
jgi:hypothetical protein